jgi:hypothetical protein
VHKLRVTRALPSSTCDHLRHLLTTTVRVRVSPSAPHSPLFNSNLCVWILSSSSSDPLPPPPSTKLIFLSLAIPWITSGTLLYELFKEADLAFNHVVICDDTLEPADLSMWSAKEDGRRGAGFVVR